METFLLRFKIAVKRLLGLIRAVGFKETRHPDDPQRSAREVRLCRRQKMCMREKAWLAANVSLEAAPGLLAHVLVTKQ